MLKTRIITAIVLAIVFLLALFNTSGFTWSLIALSATLIGVWEWAKLIHLKKQATAIYIALAFFIALIIEFSPASVISIYTDKVVFGLLGLSVLFWFIGAPLWLFTKKHIQQKFPLAILGLILLLSTWLALKGLHSINPMFLLAILAVVWLADSAAYFAGKAYGKHKLAPSISPGKTWEGVAGAMLAVTIYGLCLCYYLHISRWLIIGLWLVTALSIMGDLYESLLKRQAGVKDSSHLLPGHGGVLDRIDGLIPTLPVVLFCVYFPFFANLQLHAR
jgi:phosphatidate cytidylyltransferase